MIYAPIFRRLAALEAKQSAPKQSPSQGASKPSPRSYPKSMGKEDIAIAERLEKLKDSRKPGQILTESWTFFKFR